MKYFMRNLITTDYTDFFLEKSSDEFIQNIRSGDVYILQNAISPFILESMTKWLFSYSPNPDPSAKLVDGCQNYNQYIDTNIDPISTHTDGQTPQEIMIGIPMFLSPHDKGGLFFLKNSEGKKYYVDHLVPIGSIVIFLGNIFHGVDPLQTINNKEEINWHSLDGRWMMLLQMVESHQKKNRQSSKSFEQVSLQGEFNE